MMTKILKFGYIASGILVFLVFVGGIIGGYLRVLGPGPAFGLFALGMVGGVLLSIGGLIDLAKNGTQSRSVILLLVLIPAGSLVYGIISSRQFPAINDVTTDLVNPPTLEFAATAPENENRSMEFPATFESDIKEHYGDLEPLALARTIDEVHVNVIDAIKGIPNWEIVSTDVTSKEIIVEGTVTTEVFGFVDDFVIRLSSANSGGCVVDMRSKSRMGKSDFGQNAAHIRDLFALIRL